MKKTLLLSIALAGAFFVLPVSETKAATSAALAPEPAVAQWRQNRRSRNRVRVYTTTNTVRRRGGLFRETYRVTVRPNGNTTRTLISRVRITR